jgi:hypothetical protein
MSSLHVALKSFKIYHMFNLAYKKSTRSLKSTDLNLM